MVSKCANPDCEKQLHYLREGKVYMFETFRPPLAAGTKVIERRNEHFWLCGKCAHNMSLERNGDGGVQAVRRPLRARQVMPAHAVLAS